jgi:hypothetical protein
MAEITLAEYTGYIFLELVRAREMADEYSRMVAERYSKDSVLASFSTPRFKIPKLELTIPVLISGAKFSQVVRFTMPREEFRVMLSGRLANLLSTVRLGQGQVLKLKADQVLAAQGAPIIRWKPSSAITLQMNRFHMELVGNADPRRPETIAKANWAQLVDIALLEARLIDDYKIQNPGNALFEQSLAELIKTIIDATLVSNTRIQNLLVNPETNNVKNGSDENSVFVIRAEMIEEGFFVKTVTDAQTGEEKKIVEFE